MKWEIELYLNHFTKGCPINVLLKTEIGQTSVITEVKIVIEKLKYNDDIACQYIAKASET